MAAFTGFVYQAGLPACSLCGDAASAFRRSFITRLQFVCRLFKALFLYARSEGCNLGQHFAIFHKLFSCDSLWGGGSWNLVFQAGSAPQGTTRTGALVPTFVTLREIDIFNKESSHDRFGGTNHDYICQRIHLHIRTITLWTL